MIFVSHVLISQRIRIYLNQIQVKWLKKIISHTKKELKKFTTLGRVKTTGSPGPGHEVSLIYFSGSWQPYLQQALGTR